MKIKCTKACLDSATKHLNITLIFNDVFENNFKVVDAQHINRNGIDVVICHFNNTSGAKVESGGDSFVLNFTCKNASLQLKQALFIWWNDTEPMDLLKIDAELLKIIDNNHHLLSDEKANGRKSIDAKNAILIPKQGGNGGVLGITIC